MKPSRQQESQYLVTFTRYGITYLLMQACLLALASEWADIVFGLWSSERNSILKKYRTAAWKHENILIQDLQSASFYGPWQNDISNVGFICARIFKVFSRCGDKTRDPDFHPKKTPRALQSWETDGWGRSQKWQQGEWKIISKTSDKVAAGVLVNNLTGGVTTHSVTTERMSARVSGGSTC